MAGRVIINVAPPYAGVFFTLADALGGSREFCPELRCSWCRRCLLVSDVNQPAGLFRPYFPGMKHASALRTWRRSGTGAARG
jgi:hypothetical protein